MVDAAKHVAEFTLGMNMKQPGLEVSSSGLPADHRGLADRFLVPGQLRLALSQFGRRQFRDRPGIHDRWEDRRAGQIHHLFSPAAMSDQTNSSYD